MEYSTSTRSPCLQEDDNEGLASMSDTEAGFSGHHRHRHPPSFISRPLYATASQTRGSLRSLSSISAAAAVGSRRSGRFYDGRYEENNRPHFLDACFLCKKPLGDNKDIFMYRGDTPFCSEECRNEQIEKDEAKEKKWNLSDSMKALRKDQKKNSKSSTSPNKAQGYPLPTSTVAAA